jgi:hypothetical protein
MRPTAVLRPTNNFNYSLVIIYFYRDYRYLLSEKLYGVIKSHIHQTIVYTNKVLSVRAFFFRIMAAAAMLYLNRHPLEHFNSYKSVAEFEGQKISCGV